MSDHLLLIVIFSLAVCEVFPSLVRCSIFIMFAHPRWRKFTGLGRKSRDGPIWWQGLGGYLNIFRDNFTSMISKSEKIDVHSSASIKYQAKTRRFSQGKNAVSFHTLTFPSNQCWLYPPHPLKLSEIPLVFSVSNLFFSSTASSTASTLR